MLYVQGHTGDGVPSGFHTLNNLLQTSLFVTSDINYGTYLARRKGCTDHSQTGYVKDTSGQRYMDAEEIRFLLAHRETVLQSKSLPELPWSDLTLERMFIAAGYDTTRTTNANLPEAHVDTTKLIGFAVQTQGREWEAVLKKNEVFWAISPGVAPRVFEWSIPYTGTGKDNAVIIVHEQSGPPTCLRTYLMTRSLRVVYEKVHEIITLAIASYNTSDAIADAVARRKAIDGCLPTIRGAAGWVALETEGLTAEDVQKEHDVFIAALRKHMLNKTLHDAHRSLRNHRNLDCQTVDAFLFVQNVCLRLYLQGMRSS